jgi:tRNA(Ile2)-agmatinylcytidine synthase
LIYNNIGVEIIWIGIDDTDSRNGGCTTYIANQIIGLLINDGFSLIGYPRLVRLNPNIPWKTRGNGAISFRIGFGNGNKSKIGEIDNTDIYCYSTDKKLKDEYKQIDRVKKIVLKVFEDYAHLKDKNTNPGFVILEEQPDLRVYNKGVQEILELNEIIDIIKCLNGFYKGYKNCRGLLGAVSSIAWRSNKDHTFELITYRLKDKWGTKRIVEDETVKKIDKLFPSTFDNYDYTNKHNRIVPNSPCPILYGIRGDEVKDLEKSYNLIDSEIVDRWIIFKTNQGTDDHIQNVEINKIKSFQSVRVKGKVNVKPFTIKGGHVLFSILNDFNEKIDCAAYEPTKEFRNVIRELSKGDVVEVYGGVREQPLTINIEKIEIINLVDDFIKIENPVCPQCKKHMKSRGKNQGYECIKCKTKNNHAIMKKKERNINIGFYEVPVCARRHLSKPLKRIGKKVN